ncbi:MAG: NAD(P)H-dependent oxidoreductase subunit E [Armatimonadota bacterium]|nr:NAD(P)H-dependent oxidoreductase subunit E [bacterium]
MAQATVEEKPKTTERSFQRVLEIIEECGTKESSLIPILQKVQDEYRYLPQEILAFIATALNVPPATVFGVATFYAQFSLEPKGKYLIRMCDGTACHVRGNKVIKDAIRKKIGLKDDEKTTKDMRYTFETVSCLGACGLAPAVVINDKIYGNMTPEKVVTAINELEQEAKN